MTDATQKDLEYVPLIDADQELALSDRQVRYICELRQLGNKMGNIGAVISARKCSSGFTKLAIDAPRSVKIVRVELDKEVDDTSDYSGGSLIGESPATTSRWPENHT